MSTLDTLLAEILRLSPDTQVELARRLFAHLKEQGLWPPSRRRTRATGDVVLLFDGGSLGNPGPGYGSYIITLLDGKEVRRRVDFHGTLTNNEAEYRTLIDGLRAVQGLLGADVAQVDLEVRGDSQLVCEQLQGRWKAADPRMRSLRDQALELLRRFRSWHFNRVPRRESVRRLGH